MPSFSKKFVDFIIEPTWKLVISLQFFYLEKIISKKEMIFTQEELNIIEAENHNYSRGYESDDEEETYGLEGLIKELIKFLMISLENNQVKKKLKSYLPVFLPCIKNYCIISNEKYSLWIDDPNYFVQEEYNDLDESSLRFCSMKLIQSILKKIDLDSCLVFIRAMISEFQNDQNNNIYLSQLTLDNSENLKLVIKKLNEDKDYIIRKCEANLFILGEIVFIFKLLLKKSKLDLDKTKEILVFLHGLMQGPSSVLRDRAIWCIGKISELFENEREILEENFVCIAKFYLSENHNLSTELILSKTLKEIAFLINNNIKSENKIETFLLLNSINKNIELLKRCSEETIDIPIESIIGISRLKIQSSLDHSVNWINIILEAYLKYHNYDKISGRLIDLIELWSASINSEKLILEFLIPLFLYLTDDYFSKASKRASIEKYLEIRKTFSITINEPQIKISLETLPV